MRWREGERAVSRGEERGRKEGRRERERERGKKLERGRRRERRKGKEDGPCELTLSAVAAVASDFSSLFWASTWVRISLMLVSRTIPPVQISCRMLCTLSTWKMRSNSHTFSKQRSRVSTNTCGGKGLTWQVTTEKRTVLFFFMCPCIYFECECSCIPPYTLSLPLSLFLSLSPSLPPSLTPPQWGLT